LLQSFAVHLIGPFVVVPRTVIFCFYCWKFLADEMCVVYLVFGVRPTSLHSMSLCS